MIISYKSAEHTPPPWKQRLHAEFDLNKQMIRFSQTFLDREEIEEEESLAEGFSIETEINYSGTLSEVWADHIKSIAKTALVPLTDQTHDIIVVERDGKHFTFRDTAQAEILINELTQAVYEWLEREQPLYLAVAQNGNIQELVVSFAELSAAIREGSKAHHIPWNAWMPAVELFYQFQYDYEKARKKLPKKGNFINFGDDQWLDFELAQPAIDGIEKADALERWNNLEA